MKKIPDRQLLCNLSSLIYHALQGRNVSCIHLDNFLRDFPKEEAWNFERALLQRAMDGELSDGDLEEWITAMPPSWIRAKMMDVQDNRAASKPTILT